MPATLVAALHAAHAEPPALAPNLYERGNLRVGVMCAESLALPSTGLTVSLDGQPIESIGANGQSWLVLDDDGDPVMVSTTTDAGFLAQPGHHHLQITAPDCAALERDVDLSATYAERVHGRLEISSGELTGPVGAPNGLGVTFGAFSAALPDSMRSGTSGSGSSGSSYVVGAADAHGIWNSTSYEHRHLVVAFDTSFGWGSASGTVQSAGNAPSATGPLPFSESFFETSLALRVGARLPLREVALEAGTGLGGSVLWWTGAEITPQPGAFVMPPDGPSAMWYVPLWAAATVKPFCDWGAQVLASYDVDPTNSSNDNLVIAAGLIWQPSLACSEPSGVTVSP